MRRAFLTLTGILSVAVPGSGADLKPDAITDIPESAKRPVVVSLSKAESAKLNADVPRAILPEGVELTVAAAAPLVTHPIMGCLDDRGRLFLGDATGVNWNKEQLEKNPPNRVLLLEDTDKDGAFDKSTIFADKMTFPQGACWLDGSLYVCSPPGLWKLTDKDGDGVAEQREMIVGGFEYTGNAADVHGPFLHPNGRLYWCHGRKGHKITQKDGTLVHEGMACGIWSCRPDGTDIQWHSLGSGDNPVEVDFTPEGEVIGVQNLYYNQPRGDTIVHWLYGGVYERADQMKAIEGLPRTLEHMPVMYNFGHVAVSGCCFARSGALFPASPLQFLVTHFNTQRVVRMELTPDGATFKATEHEFLRLPESPDIHFTDVMEDADGSLLVVDTGGWFRIGCPASLMAKPDVTGAVYRVRSTRGAAVKRAPLVTKAETWAVDLQTQLAVLKSGQPHERRRALDWVSQNLPEDWRRDKVADTEPEKLGEQIRHMMRGRLDPAEEHALLHAALKMNLLAVTLDDLRTEKQPTALRRMLVSFVPDDGSAHHQCMEIAAEHLDSQDEELARVALSLVAVDQDADERVVPGCTEWLSAASISSARLNALRGLCAALLGKPETQKLMAAMLQHSLRDVRSAALQVLAGQTQGVGSELWLGPLEKALEQSQPGDLPMLLEAIKKLKSDRFNAKLQTIADDAKQPLPLRLKALDAMKGGKMTPATFALLQEVLQGSTASAAARIQAAQMLAAAPLDAAETTAVAPVLASVGPVELKELTALIRKNKDATLLRTLTTELAKNPALGSMQESHYRTAFADKPTELFEGIVLPALRKANEYAEAKKQSLPTLAGKAATKGNIEEGKKHFAAGKGSCIACHKIGELGRALGPDLTSIGAIRTERDLLESILFPSNTLARDYEAHVIETSDGQSCMGVIKSHTAEGLLVVDVAGQEKTVAHGTIVADTVLTTSLMPMGLDGTMSEQELCDMVAWLRSLK